MNAEENSSIEQTKYMINKIVCVLFFVCVTVVAVAQTKEQVEKELKRQGVPHWNIVLAQARLETGNFTSRLCKENKNLFGIKHGNRYARYKRWQDSVADYKKRISSRYKGGNYMLFLKRIGYAKDEAYNRKLNNIIKSEK